MNSARHDLILLVRLQKVYDQITEAIRERSTPPSQVQELQEANRGRQDELDRLVERVGHLEAQLREVRRREEEYRLELEHFHRQRSMVTNEREFSAVISEIDYATKGIQESAGRRAELEAELEAFNSDIARRRESRPEEESARREVVAGWEQRKDELKKRIHDLALEAQAIEADIRPPSRSRFLRLLESKKGSAIAELVDGSCSACHFSIRLHLQQRVRRCEEIIFCEHCRRILFSRDSMIDTDAVGADGSRPG